MRAECLPFHRIPHTSRLFADFLYDFPKLQRFYPRSPQFQDWVREEALRIAYDPARRARVAAVLERQNQAWGASAKALENIARLKAGACAVVTGQQVGLFGGPLFAVFKALTAVKLAAEATAAGVECVPVFWLATEDHDLAEVNHAFLSGPDGALRRLATPTHGLPDAPVGKVRFGDEITAVVEEAAAVLGETDTAAALRQAYRPGETMGSAFARLLARVFAEWGVILLDAADPELHAIVAPMYRSALEQAAELDAALLERGRQLTSAGYHEQVKVTPSSTPLFTLRDGARVPIHRVNGGSGGFEIAGHKIGREELLQQIATAPHHFSPNVLLRPVVQDYLLPTLAYTGGPAEVAYFAQAAVAYQMLLGRVTPVVPRFTATLVEPKLASLFERYGLAVTDLFHGEEALRERLSQQAIPRELQQAFDAASQSLESSLGGVRSALNRLDVTLVEAAARAGSKMQYQLRRLRSRAARAELLRAEILSRHAAQLSHALYPEKTLQERQVAGIYFLSRYGGELLHGLYDALNPACLDHQLIYL